jgi:outer membrane protein OmpA-like peptidoglycan-associated protein
LLLGSLEPGAVVLDVGAPGFVPANGAALTLTPGAQERIVRLAWVPVAVDVRVTDAAGAPVDAEVRFDGPADVAPVRVGPTGRAEVELRPGRWSVLASAPSLGAKRAEATVVAGGRLQRVDLVLAAARVDVTAVSVVIKEQVNFDFDRAVLRVNSAAVLDEVAATLLSHPEIARVEIQGHTDNKGDLTYNLSLSGQRAEAVRDALAARGVAPERLVARGYGATRPVATNDDDAGRAKNRRVQFEITERTR